MTTKIEKKVRARKYSSLAYAIAAIKRSNLTSPAQRSLLTVAHEVYSQTPDRLEETTDIGKIPEKGLVAPLSLTTSTDIEKELMRVALKLHYLMGQHKLSREQIFDRLKETMI